MQFKIVLLLIGIMATLAWRANAQFNYTINNGTVTITGYSGSSGAVVIPSTIAGFPVTVLGDGVHSVFAYTGATGVTITNNVTTIASYAFQMTSSMTSIIIGTNVTTIGSGAFFYCNGLTSVAIPNSITSMGSYAFENCYNLTSVTISSGLTSIAEGVFDYCPHLSNVAIPNSVTSIGELAFANDTGLTSITLPNNLNSIGSFAFGSCGLTSVTIPASVTSIGDDAFNSIYSLARVYFAGNAPSLGSYVFGGDSATVYYLPGTMGWITFNASSQLSPAVLWNPQAQNNAGFGVQNNQFGFNINGTSNLVIVVEACTNLNNPAWQPVQTVTLTGGASYFSDPQWTNYPARFYRFSSQ